MIITNYYAVLPTVILRDPLLKPSEKLLYAELSTRIGTGKYCLVTYADLAEDCGCTESTIHSYLGSLEKRGYLRIEDGKAEKKKITLLR